MLRHFIATHVRMASLAVALVFMSVIATTVAGLAIYNQGLAIAAAQQQGLEQVQSIRVDVTQTLRTLNQNFQPDCTEPNLRAIRELLFKARFIGDVGIFDGQNRLACTSTAGVLPQALVVPPPDAALMTPEGEPILTNFNAELLVAGQNIRSTIVRMERFNAVILPHALYDILQGGASAVVMSRPGSPLIFATHAPDLSDAWKKLLLTPEYSTHDRYQFHWSAMAFIANQRVGESPYVVQTVVPLSAFWNSYRYNLIAGSLLTLLVGWLAYQAARPRFARWRGLEYRINHLLEPQNIICMYQPIVDLRTGRATGCEVLMRLRDGDEVIYPDQAIPAIVANKLTWKLDQAVVHKALAELAMHLPQLRDFKIAFNFFPDNLVSNQVCQLFRDATRHAANPGFQYDVEVLEQHYQKGMTAEIVELRKNNFLVSVDDFGTGYSNLGSIKAISPDFLKIDRSFVTDMEDDTLRSSLIPEIVSIGRAVGAAIIAEGIENERQMQMLLELGVEFGQGYYLGRPQPIEAFSTYLKSNLP